MCRHTAFGSRRALPTHMFRHEARLLGGRNTTPGVRGANRPSTGLIAPHVLVRWWTRSAVTLPPRSGPPSAPPMWLAGGSQAGVASGGRASSFDACGRAEAGFASRVFGGTLTLSNYQWDS